MGMMQPQQGTQQVPQQGPQQTQPLGDLKKLNPYGQGGTPQGQSPSGQSSGMQSALSNTRYGSSLGGANSQQAGQSASSLGQGGLSIEAQMQAMNQRPEQGVVRDNLPYGVDPVAVKNDPEGYAKWLEGYKAQQASLQQGGQQGVQPPSQAGQGGATSTPTAPTGQGSYPLPPQQSTTQGSQNPNIFSQSAGAYTDALGMTRGAVGAPAGNVQSQNVRGQGYNPATGRAAQIGGVSPINAQNIRSVDTTAQGYTASQLNQPKSIDAINAEAAKASARGYDASTISGVGPLSAQQVGTQTIADNMGRYQNPYENQVVDAALSDIERSRLMGTNQVGASATAANAYGGSRHGVMEAETNRAALEQAAKTASQLRSQGFNTAAQLGGQDVATAQQAALANQSASLQADTTSAQQALQAQLANQGALNQASQFGVNAQNQAAQQNAARQMQANLANQGVGMQAQTQNVANQMQAGIANQNATNQASQFGAQAANTATQADAARNMQAQMANQSAGLQAQTTTGQQALQAQQANQNALNQMTQANMNARNQAGSFGASANNAANLANQATNMQAQLANQSNQNQFANRLMSAGNQMGNLSNLGFGMGNTLNQNQMNAGNMQQALQQQIINAGKDQFGNYTNSPQNALNVLLSAYNGSQTGQKTEEESRTPGLFDIISAGAMMMPRTGI